MGHKLNPERDRDRTPDYWYDFLTNTSKDSVLGSVRRTYPNMSPSELKDFVTIMLQDIFVCENDIEWWGR